MKKNVKKHKLSNKVIKECRKNFGETFKKLRQIYPNAHCALNYENPWQLLIATILSAQCTDKRVNMVTPVLFKKYPKVDSMAQADLEELQDIIRSTGFYRNKAKNILACCKKIVGEFKENVPNEMSNLVSLPGVARKTANVVLWNAFGINEGVVVDTHVGRISQRLGWTDNIAPVKIEQDLIKMIPKKSWGEISHLLIDLGRDVCKAPKPNCKSCQLVELCPWFKNVINK